MILCIKNQDEEPVFGSSDFFSNKSNSVGVNKKGSDFYGSIAMFAISDLIFNLCCWKSHVNFKHGSVLNQEEGISV